MRRDFKKANTQVSPDDVSIILLAVVAALGTVGPILILENGIPISGRGGAFW